MDEMFGFRMGPIDTRLGPKGVCENGMHIRILQDKGNFVHLTGQGVHFGQ